MNMIRGTSLAGFAELVRSLDADPDALLRRHRIPRTAVGNFDSFVDYLGLLRLLEDAARVTGTPDFGRRLADLQGIEILGVVGAAARTAPTVRGAVAIVSRYLGTYSPAIETRLDTDDKRPGVTTFEFRIVADRLPSHAQGVELALGVALRVFRILLGSAWSPLAVHFPHAAIAPREEYVRYFGTRPAFEDSLAGFTIRSRDLDQRLAPDAATHAALLAYLEVIVPPGRSSVSSAVAELVRRLCPTGGLRLELVAEQMGLHERTLQRRLAEEGTSYAEVVDAVRRTVCQRLLRDTDMTLGHLARELGYAEQGALTRACRRWFGVAPLAYRRALRLGSDAAVDERASGQDASSAIRR